MSLDMVSSPNKYTAGKTPAVVVSFLLAALGPFRGASELVDLLHQLVHKLLLRYLVKDFSLTENQTLSLAAGDSDVRRRGLTGAVDGRIPSPPR